MAAPRRLKIVVSAYACSPFQGSEPGVGWGFVTALARHHDLWVIVEEEKFRRDIERFLNEHPDHLPSVRFHFISKVRNRPLRKIWPPSYYWYYRRWHQDAFDLAKQLHDEVGFDLAHQLTMVGFREPGYLWKLPIPFVWGPVGGLGLVPWKFLPALGIYGGAYYALYNLLNLRDMYLATRPRMAARRTNGALLAATSENQREIARLWNVPSVVVSEVGPPLSALSEGSTRVLPNHLAIVWSGQHTPGKALPLALKALARLPDDITWRLEILGRGELTDRYRRLAQRLGIAGRCTFHGWIPRAEALSVMRSCHLSLITSLRDLTSTVTLEALSNGLPVICFDHCGFADAVDESCGIKIPLMNPRKTIAETARAIEALARDRERLDRLSQGALQRSRMFDWERKVDVVNQLYERCMRGRLPTGDS